MNHKRIILVGPTCSGKTYIRDKFREKGYKIDVSYTSREPRPGEINNVDYCFISKYSFDERIYYKQFYEFTEYNNNYYGTGIIHWNECDVFIMETEGISKIKSEDRPNCLIIYLDTPLKTRTRRMHERGWDAVKISERLEVDIAKFKNFKDYDLKISSE